MHPTNKDLAADLKHAKSDLADANAELAAAAPPLDLVKLEAEILHYLESTYDTNTRRAAGIINLIRAELFPAPTDGK